GTLSTEAIESGPFTSLEQAMLASELEGRQLIRGFGLYNAVAAAAGSVGALAAGGPALLRHIWSAVPSDQRFFLVFVPVALAGGALRPPADDAVRPPAVQPPAGRARTGPEPRRRHRPAVRPGRAVGNGRPHPPGLRDGAGGAGGADRGRGRHQHGPLRRPSR